MISRQLTICPVLRKFAEEHQMQLLNLDGQCVFTRYSISGGLTNGLMCYFLLPGNKWPDEIVDLGREKYPHPAILVAEFPMTWSDEQILDHLTELLNNRENHA